MAANDDEWTQKQLILEQFRDVTLTDLPTALQLLETCSWDIDVALDKYLSAKPGEDPMGTTGNPIEIPDSPDKLQTPQSVSILQPTSQDNQLPVNTSDNLKLLSWNIDGLDQHQIRERTRYVVNLIKERLPDVVYLQEVIEETFQFFTRQLQDYLVLKADSTAMPYFNAILIRKTTIKPTRELQCKHFMTSRMGRHLLTQHALFHNNIKLTLMTSHLESTKDHAQERKNQLKDILYTEISSQDADQFVIFGGDLNVRDKEVEAIGIPWRISDMWEACGSNKATKYTWDTSVNDNLDMPWKCKLRFDRIYYRENGSVSLNPVCFKLVGQERLASGCFPSDHWGIWFEFQQSQLQKNK